MYDDSRNRRILMSDGTSLVEEDEYAVRLLNGDVSKSMKTLPSRGTQLFHERFGHPIHFDVDTFTPPTAPSHQHTEESVDELLNIIVNMPRYENGDVEVERLQVELDYFQRTNNILFILKLHDLINRFKAEGIVWGVGRGSSCSSYLMYVLEVNDINPIKYDIPFNEMSKEA